MTTSYNFVRTYLGAQDVHECSLTHKRNGLSVTEWAHFSQRHGYIILTSGSEALRGENLRNYLRDNEEKGRKISKMVVSRDGKEKPSRVGLSWIRAEKSAGVSK